MPTSPPRRRRHAPARRAAAGRGRGDRPGLAARAAGRGRPACWPRTRRPSWRGSNRAIGELRETLDQMLATSDLGRRRAARGARGLPHVRPGHRLAAPDPRGDRHRPFGRGRGPARAGGDPGPDRPRQRPLSARAADRPRRHRQPPAAPCWSASRAATIRRSCPTTRSWWPATSVPPTCSSTTAASCAASCSRRARRPRTSPSSPAPSASRCWAGSRVPWRRSTPATRWRSTATTGMLYVRPNDEILQAFHNAMRARAERRRYLRRRSASCPR